MGQQQGKAERKPAKPLRNELMLEVRWRERESERASVHMSVR